MRRRGEKIWGTGDQSEGEGKGKGIWKGGPFVGKLTGWNINQRRPTTRPFRLPHPCAAGTRPPGPCSSLLAGMPDWRSFGLFPGDVRALQTLHRFDVARVFVQAKSLLGSNAQGMCLPWAVGLLRTPAT